jgi:hypothetical protein
LDSSPSHRRRLTRPCDIGHGRPARPQQPKSIEHVRRPSHRQTSPRCRRPRSQVRTPSIFQTLDRCIFFLSVFGCIELDGCRA